MKKNTFIIGALILLATHTSFSQEIAQSEVPSVVLNTFKQSFPKAADLEWEKEGEQFKVEFESPGDQDHEIWYSASGQLLKHTEDIPKNELPKNVLATLKRDFQAFEIDDVEKIAADNTISYAMELESATEEWDVVIGSDGKVIHKVAD